MSHTQTRTLSRKTPSPRALPPEALSPKAQEAPAINTMSGCLVRLCWMAFGNCVLVYSALFILQNSRSFLSAADAVFWAVLAAVIAVRYVDIKRFHGQTVTCEPATMAHWRRYVMFMLGISFVIWSLAHVMARWVA